MKKPENKRQFGVAVSYPEPLTAIHLSLIFGIFKSLSFHIYACVWLKLATTNFLTQAQYTLYEIHLSGEDLVYGRGRRVVASTYLMLIAAFPCSDYR